MSYQSHKITKTLDDRYVSITCNNVCIEDDLAELFTAVTYFPYDLHNLELLITVDDHKFAWEMDVNTKMEDLWSWIVSITEAKMEEFSVTLPFVHVRVRFWTFEDYSGDWIDGPEDVQKYC